MKFRKGTYYDLQAMIQKEGDNSQFKADLTHVDSKRVAGGKDFDQNTGQLKKPGSVVLLDQEGADALVNQLKKADWKVSNLEVKVQKRNPAPPFITSTLQQEANRKFGFSARDTMSVAQKLYEKGFITYMRTDSTRLSSQAIEAAREVFLISMEKNIYSSKCAITLQKEKVRRKLMRLFARQDLVLLCPISRVYAIES